METTKYHELVPSMGGSYSYAWRKMFEKSFLILLVAVIIVGLLNGPGAGVNWKMDGKFDFDFPWIFLFPVILFGLAYSFLFVPIIKYGENLLFVKAMRDEEADIKTLFDGFRTQYLNIVLANLIVAALLIIGFVMLIIPGIIIACRLAFVSYLVMDKNMEAMKAVEESWRMTRGYGWTIFGMGVIAIFVFIAGLVCCFVGVIFSFIWIHAAFAIMYLSVQNLNDDNNPIPILGVNEVK
jgi:hypothetical protein